eukprot:gb/GECH01007078.1/.p1 GENE.gb/GECH01007078.1/~~gb/GECH01007078.1/.p1  ORF type:complete len:519 (+),score=137.58 gb/GECH01007078.1/:1-1557(+)
MITTSLRSSITSTLRPRKYNTHTSWSPHYLEFRENGFSMNTRLSPLLHNSKHFTTTRTVSQNKPSICIAGSGPAGFYAAKYLLRQHSDVHITILEKLPVPYGLVRFGVAPDHPEVKNVESDFEKIALSERCSYLGNVEIGKDVSVEELKNLYDGVILAYGAAADRKLNVPGEDAKGVHSARKFVEWYNGLPEQSDNTEFPHLLKQSSSVVVIGQGNVAMDVTRMMAKPVSEISTYDTTHFAVSALESSAIRDIHVVGRRGPLQAACTTKEFRELTNIPDAGVYIDPKDLDLELSGGQDELKAGGRALKRLYQVFEKNAGRSSIEHQEDQKRIHMRFFLTPKEIIWNSEGNVEAVAFEKTKLEGEPRSMRAVGTGEVQEIPCSFVLKSIGYRSIGIEGVPFDEKRGIIPNENGKVTGHDSIYVAGWLKRGPTGIIGTNLMCSQATVQSVLTDLEKRRDQDQKQGIDGLKSLLEEKDVPSISFEQYKKIEQEEENRGKASGKLKEKIVDVDEMLQVAGEN